MRVRSGCLALAAAFVEGDSLPAVCLQFGDEFFLQAEHDFKPFHGLSPLDAQRTRALCLQQAAACFRVQIIEGRVYVADEQPGFQSRNRITMAHLQRLAARFGPLPDTEFVVDTSDGYSDVEAPLFVIAKFPRSSGGILYPDFSSFAWPESECPSTSPGSHVWHSVARTISASATSWDSKQDMLFWRGAPTSVYRRQVLPTLAETEGANVSFLEWEKSVEGRQGVRSGSCVPLEEWCGYRFLANLPGNTMALSLKYRLLCGSVVLSPPLWYHEWYYSMLQPNEHYVEVDVAWSGAQEALRALRSAGDAARAIGERARNWAVKHLSDDAFDCYWYNLLQLAHVHFPKPTHPAVGAVPLEHAMLSPLLKAHPPPSAAAGTGTGQPESAVPGPTTDVTRTKIDVVIVIPTRARDAQLLQRARQTWLQERSPGVEHRHYFVLSAQDPDLEVLGAAGSSPGLFGSDFVIVGSPHGYRWLLQKMALAYRLLLSMYDVAFFVRADVDSVLPLHMLLPLLPLAAVGEAVVAHRQRGGGPSCAGAPSRWVGAAVGPLVCQSECAMDRGCRYFVVSEAGDCRTFSHCKRGFSGTGPDTEHDLFEYRLRSASQDPPEWQATQWRDRMATRRGPPFILGTILFENRVLVDDTHNPQWNNPAYRHDLGLRVYPPYPEASGYAISAELAAFLASVGGDLLPTLSWKAWAIEDAALGTVLAGLNISMLQLPAEVRDRMRVIRVPKNHTMAS